MDPSGPGGLPYTISGVLTNVTSSIQTVTFIIQGSANGCAATPVPAFVNVYAPPPLNLITGPNNVCTQNTIDLDNATPGGVWTSSFPAIASVNSSTGVVTGLTTGSTNITYTITDGNGCKNSVSQFINVNPSPTVNVVGSTTICLGQSASITATGSITPSQTVSFTNFNSGPRGFQQSNPLVPFPKSITVTMPPGITQLSQITNISVSVDILHQRDGEMEFYLVTPGSTINLTGPGPETINNCDPVPPYQTPYTQCFTPGQVMVLTNNYGGNGANYTNTVFSDQPPGAPNISTGTAPFTGTYHPVMPFSSLTPTINPNGTWTLIMVDEVGSGYTGVFNSWTISFTIPGTGGTYNWTTNPVDPLFSGSGPGTYSVSPTQTTDYTLTASAPNGCSVSSTATITVNQPIIANAGPDQANCNSGSFTLAGNSPAPGTGVWTVQSGTASVTTPGSPTSGVTGVPAGTSVTIRWSVTTPGCPTPSTDDVVLTNANPPTGTGVTICPGGSGSLTSASTCPAGGSPITSGPRFAELQEPEVGQRSVWTNPTQGNCE